MAGVIKKSYYTAATLALLNLLALGGGVAYLVATGRLDAERARRMAAILQGEVQGEVQEPASAVPAQADPDVPATSETSALPRDEQRTNDEIARRNAERYRTQLEQRLKFINAERLDVDRRREEFEKLTDQEETQRAEASKNAKEPGFVKELDVINSLSPNAALRQLMTMNDADVARILFDLDTRKTKKIVEAAKTDVQRSKMTSALLLMRDIKRVNHREAPDSSEG